MKFLILVALAAATSSEFTCIKPINPIPAGLPGVCCADLIQGSLLTFVYTGKNCTHAIKLSEGTDGSQTYGMCDADRHAACCDPLVTELSPTSNPACVLPE